MVLLISCRVCLGISAKQFIDQAIGNGGRVLVHCNGEPHSKGVSICKGISYCLGGISLSPAFVVMFVMQHYQLSWEDALHMVQNRRYCISPNGGFLTQIKVFYHKIQTFEFEPTVINPLLCKLKEYEAIYRANVAVASYPTVQRTASRRKREDDDDDDDDQRYVSSTRHKYTSIKKNSFQRGRP